VPHYEKRDGRRIVEILLVNDDGIHAPGLAAIREKLQTWGNVTVVAPAVEQSGVGHTITYLHPIVVHREYRSGEFLGWKVEGSPADCVKLGILEFCPRKPDLVVSGINHGANCGINVLYSGTVAAAVEGAFFGVPSIALSQWLEPPPDFASTAEYALELCKLLYAKSTDCHALWNVNFPANRPGWPMGTQLVAMGVKRTRDTVEKRTDPRGRTYFWSGLEPIKSHDLEPGTDIQALHDGYATITPLHFDLTEQPILKQLAGQEWPGPPDRKSVD